MSNERSVQAVSKPFNIFKNKGNVLSMLNESLNQFKFGSTALSSNMSNRRKRVSSDIQTLRSRLNKRGAAEFF